MINDNDINKIFVLIKSFIDMFIYYIIYYNIEKMADMDNILDLFEEDSNDNDIKNENYYIFSILNLIKSADENSLYIYVMLKTLLSKKELLNDNQIKEIADILNIKPKTIIKEKVVEKIVYKERKAKINNYDDY